METREIKKMKKKASFIVAFPMMIALALTGCTSNAATLPEADSASPTVSSNSATPTTSVAPTDESVKPAEQQPSSEATSVKTALEKLTVANEADADSYERDFFNHWTKVPGSSCDTRFAVLVSESLVKAKISGCKVISGEWKSVYDGKTVTDPSELDIDHMVPLKEAWRSGASKWDAKKREDYANDLGLAEALVAVSAASNRSKSDSDPAGYLPTDASYRCSYVAQWISVKTRWNLSVDAAEKSAITSVLKGCDSGATVTTAPQTSAPVETSAAPTASETIATPVASEPAPVAVGGNDPQFSSCKAATAAGYGPYTKGEPEYEWYRDGDGDGTVCEK